MSGPQAPAGRPVTTEALAEAAGEKLPPEDYFDTGSGKFLTLNESGRWLPLTEANYKRHLRSRGQRHTLAEGETLSETDLTILEVQNHRDVSFYGPLCGRNSGFHEENGSRFLVTEDMNLPQPAPGDFGNLRAVIEGLFLTNESEDTGQCQLATFLGWLRSSVHALRAGKAQQQQALAICGPANCGKSLLQHLVTDMLAGRSVKAERYFSGKTDFNADLFAAEHLILEDEHCSTRIADRHRLGASLKEHTVGTQTSSLHAKKKTPVNLRPWWRITLTLNDDPEAMMILPPLDEHVADKIILLRAGRFDFPMPCDTTEERERFRETLVNEIPAFLHWLLHEWEMPAEVSDPRRYNVATYHHPELAAALESLSPEAELLDFIDDVFRDRMPGRGWIEEEASAIERMLRDANPKRADKLLTFRNACGTYLGRLERKHPDRVQYRRNAKSRWWQIKPG